MSDRGVGPAQPHLDRSAIRPGIRGVARVLAASFGTSGRRRARSVLRACRSGASPSGASGVPPHSVWGVIFYAIASILDHADSEIARLTFQEPSPAPTWTVDTIIRAGLVLGMAVTAGGAASSAPSGSPSARSSPATSARDYGWRGARGDAERPRQPRSRVPPAAKLRGLPLAGAAPPPTAAGRRRDRLAGLIGSHVRILQVRATR